MYEALRKDMNRIVESVRIIELFESGLSKKSLISHVCNIEGITKREAQEKVELVLYEVYMRMIGRPAKGVEERRQNRPLRKLKGKNQKCF